MTALGTVIRPCCYFYSYWFGKVNYVPNLFERPIKPPGGDAEIGFVRCHMMNAVMSSRQHNVTVLKDRDPPGKAPICVRPLVDLICHRHKYGAKEQVCAERIRLIDIRAALGHQIPSDFDEQRQRDHKIVAICLDEVMPGYGGWVDVMFPEWSQKVLRGRFALQLNVFVRVYLNYTFPKTGTSTENHVSAAQWTKPDPKSAVKMPARPAITTRAALSVRKCRIIR